MNALSDSSTTTAIKTLSSNTSAHAVVSVTSSSALLLSCPLSKVTVGDIGVPIPAAFVGGLLSIKN